MAKKLGEVYWANSQKIDKTDSRKRRQYAILKDNGRNVAVSKIRGYNNNNKNLDRLYKLDEKKYPLSKPSGIDKKLYTRESTSNKLLRINDRNIFDSSPSFKLSSHDTHNAIRHTRTSTNKKRR